MSAQNWPASRSIPAVPAPSDHRTHFSAVHTVQIWGEPFLKKKKTIFACEAAGTLAITLIEAI